MTNWLKRLFGGSGSSTTEAPEPATAPEPPTLPDEPAAAPEPFDDDTSDAGDEPA